MVLAKTKKPSRLSFVNKTKKKRKNRRNQPTTNDAKFSKLRVRSLATLTIIYIELVSRSSMKMKFCAQMKAESIRTVPGRPLTTTSTKMTSVPKTRTSTAILFQPL